MVKRTKSQKKRLAMEMNNKANMLFMEGLISSTDLEKIALIRKKADRKLM